MSEDTRSHSLRGCFEIPRDVCNATSLKMCCADFQGIWEIASLPGGPLKRQSVLIS